MRIITNRNIRLAGERFESGRPQDCADAEGRIAIRNGWAVEAPATARAPRAKARADGKAKAAD